MDKKKENVLRERLTAELKSYFDEKGEDTGYIETNKFNFPAVSDDGEEFWYTITVTIPHYKAEDNGLDAGYDLRTAYELKANERKAKAEKILKAKAEKIAKTKKKATDS